jgi:hypothetical protein
LDAVGADIGSNIIWSEYISFLKDWKVNHHKEKEGIKTKQHKTKTKTKIK